MGAAASGGRPMPAAGELQVLEYAEAMARLGDDRELFDEMVQYYREDGPPLVEQIREGVASDDAEMVVKAAHTLKSLAATCGGTRVARAASMLEEAGRVGGLTNGVEQLAELEREIGHLKAVLPLAGKM
jgi:HPt (histidine-containing phosphotransfer) domain-containing protein